MHQVIALNVFVPFAVLCSQQPLKRRDLWVTLCLVGNVHFIFLSRAGGRRFLA